MNVLKKIFKLIRPYVTESKKIITILICILILQTLIGILYIRSLKKYPVLGDEAEKLPFEQHLSFKHDPAFSQTEIAFILQLLNISHDELCQYYQPQLDNINNMIKKKEQELDELKNQLRKNPNSENNTELKSRISFIEEQVIFYQAEASFWDERSKGLRNLIKTLGLDSIMAYLTHKDSIDNILVKLAPPKIIIPDRIERERISTTNPLKTSNQAVSNNTLLPTTTASSQQHVTIEKKTETESNLSNGKQIILSSQASAISQNEMRAMLAKYNLFDYYWNQNAIGFANKFEVQIMKGDSVVIDSATRLMWQHAGSSVAMNFEAAKKWIGHLNDVQFGGHRDWRLPTLKEAMTLVEPRKANLLYIDSLFTKEQNWIWTSDFVAGKDCAWVVSFSLGGCRSSYALSTSNYYIRAVRSVKAHLN